MNEQSSNGKAIAGLVLGIVSIVLIFFGAYGAVFGLICGVIGIILSIKARNETQQELQLPDLYAPLSEPCYVLWALSPVLVC